MTVYGFLTPFRNSKLFGMASCVFDKFGCARGEKKRNILVMCDFVIDTNFKIFYENCKKKYKRRDRHIVNLKLLRLPGLGSQQCPLRSLL
jgi:hypothetical protein